MMKRLMIPVLALALAGCDETVAGPAPTLEVSVAQDGLLLSLVVARQESSATGAPFRFTTSLTNQTNQPVRLEFSSGCQVLFFVETADGERVYPDPMSFSCTQAETTLEIAPGETVQRSTSWSPVRNVFQNGNRTTVALPSGTYYAFAEVRGRTLEQPRMRTEKVAFQVR
jgi:hypothetical protein